MAKQRHTSLAVTHLTALQQLAVLDSREDPTWLAQAAALPALQHLKLRCVTRRLDRTTCVGRVVSMID